MNHWKEKLLWTWQIWRVYGFDGMKPDSESLPFSSTHVKLWAGLSVFVEFVQSLRESAVVIKKKTALKLPPKNRSDQQTNYKIWNRSSHLSGQHYKYKWARQITTLSF